MRAGVRRIKKQDNRLHDMVVILRQYATSVSPVQSRALTPPQNPHACDYSCHLKCMTRDHCFLILSGLFRRLKRRPRGSVSMLGDERVSARAFKTSRSNMLNEVLFICRAIGRAPPTPHPHPVTLFAVTQEPVGACQIDSEVSRCRREIAQNSLIYFSVSVAKCTAP